MNVILSRENSTRRIEVERRARRALHEWRRRPLRGTASGCPRNSGSPFVADGWNLVANTLVSTLRFRYLPTASVKIDW